MDVKAYYQSIRRTEATISGEFVVMASLDTPDGGRAGTYTEVPRYLAAKLVVESKARFASDPEADAYYAKMRTLRREAERAEMVAKMPFVFSRQALAGPEADSGGEGD